MKARVGTARIMPIPPAALELVAARFRAMGEPLRLRILQRLEQGECSVSVLARGICSTQPNVSRHLRILQDAGLVRRRQSGTSALYSIADPMVAAICDLVCSGLRERLEAQMGALGGGRIAAPRPRSLTARKTSR